MIQTENEDDVPLIYRLGLPEAERAGLIVRTGTAGDVNVYVSRRLMDEGTYSLKMRRDMIDRGFRLLSRPYPDDLDQLHVRYIDVYEVWVIRIDEGITFLKGDDLEA